MSDDQSDDRTRQSDDIAAKFKTIAAVDVMDKMVRMHQNAICWLNERLEQLEDEKDKS